MLEEPEQDVRGVWARKHMRALRLEASERRDGARGGSRGRKRDGQGPFKEAEMGRDITRPVVIGAVARETLSGRPAQVVGCESGGRVLGGYPVTKTMDTGRRTGLQGVVDEDGREVDLLLWCGRAFGKSGTRCDGREGQQQTPGGERKSVRVGYPAGAERPCPNSIPSRPDLVGILEICANTGTSA